MYTTLAVSWGSKNLSMDFLKKDISPGLGTPASKNEGLNEWKEVGSEEVLKVFCSHMGSICYDTQPPSSRT